jgi:hypothetical protein
MSALLWIGIGVVTSLVVILLGLFFYYRAKKTSTPASVNLSITTRASHVEDVGASIGQTMDPLDVSGSTTAMAPVVTKAAIIQTGPAHVVTSTKNNVIKAYKEGFAGSQQKTDTLLNFQPITVKQAGFIGPVVDGVFEEGSAVLNAIKAGVRSFVLQIDYIEDAKDSKLFPPVREPCLLYRDKAGALDSLNAGSIQKVADALAQHAFNDRSSKFSKDPLIVILHGTRAPDAVAKPKEYLDYCSKIAKALKPLAPHHLGSTPLGNYHRQALQGQIFTRPIHDFQKKVIVLTTFDTSLFRNTEKLKIPAYKPAADLDYWSNAQIYKENATDLMGVATIAPAKVTPRARIFSAEALLALGADEKTGWAVKERDVFTIALPGPEKNPSVDETTVLLNSMGVNVVPLDLFSFETADVKALTNLWKKKTWKMRPVALQSA